MESPTIEGHRCSSTTERRRKGIYVLEEVSLYGPPTSRRKEAFFKPADYLGRVSAHWVGEDSQIVSAPADVYMRKGIPFAVVGVGGSRVSDS